MTDARDLPSMDDTALNADWTKAGTWDVYTPDSKLVRNVDQLRQANPPGTTDAQLVAMLDLPVAQSMAARLKRQLEKMRDQGVAEAKNSRSDEPTEELTKTNAGTESQGKTGFRVVCRRCGSDFVTAEADDFMQVVFSLQRLRPGRGDALSRMVSSQIGTCSSSAIGLLLERVYPKAIRGSNNAGHAAV